MEKRNTVRYKLSLPVLYSWSDPEGKNWKEGGFTRDISTGGLYVIGAETPMRGHTVDVEVLLPLARIASTGIARLRAKCTVVRSGGPSEDQGFAAAGNLDSLSTLNAYAKEHSGDDTLVKEA